MDIESSNSHSVQSWEVQWLCVQLGCKKAQGCVFRIRGKHAIINAVRSALKASGACISLYLPLYPLYPNHELFVSLSIAYSGMWVKGCEAVDGARQTWLDKCRGHFLTAVPSRVILKHRQLMSVVLSPIVVSSIVVLKQVSTGVEGRLGAVEGMFLFQAARSFSNHCPLPELSLLAAVDMGAKVLIS